MDNPESTFTIPEEAIDVSKDGDGGVRKLITKEGSGDALPFTGSKVTVHYTGKLTNGEIFDSSVDRGTPFEFTLGEGQVIKAWDQGVASMRKGECATLYCAPDYAYGAKESPKIPANSQLIFEVELISWAGKTVDGTDNKVTKLIIKEGKDWSKPNDGATVEVRLKGSFEGKVFDEREESFIVGEGSEKHLPRGVEKAIQDMKRCEVAQYEIESSYGFGSDGWPEKGVPANADVQYEIELKNFEKAKESWEMDEAEKVNQAELHKSKGTEMFKAGKYELAQKRYEKVTDLLGSESLGDELKEKGSALVLAAHLNIAMCALKAKAFAKALDSCDKALELEASNEKGLFRRGQANLELQNFDEAQADFSAVLAVNSENKAARNQLTLTKHYAKAAKDKQRRIYKGMFDKFAAQDQIKAPTPEAGDNGGEAVAEGKEVTENGNESADVKESV